jgi:ADP-L-glycero-D-manno-heptose 6-epimerase
LIYASSAATYGAGELGYDDRLDSEKLKPLNLYGESKVQMDRWAVQQKATPVHWYGLKFFNVYGPNEAHKGSMSSVAYKAFHQIRETGEMKLFKSYVPEFKHGEQKRDFVYVKDVSAWHLELMQKLPLSGIYNMGYGRARTWQDLARATFKALQKPEKIDFIDMPENIRGQYQYFTEAAMSRWKTLGMSAPRWSLEEGVRDYVQSYLLQKDPQL